MEVQAAAEEVDGCLEVLSVPVAASPALDGHDLAIESLGPLRKAFSSMPR